MTETRIVPLEIKVMTHALTALLMICTAAIGFFPIYMRPEDYRLWITPLIAIVAVFPPAVVAIHILVKPWAQRRIAAANSEEFSEALSLVDRAYWITIVVAGVVGIAVAFSVLQFRAHEAFSITTNLVAVACATLASVITAKALQRLIRPWARAKLDEAEIDITETA